MGLTNSCEKKRSKNQRKKERYKHLNAEFQRIARRDKKAFLSDLHFSLSCIGEGNGNLLQCSYVENPRDWGAWWAAVYGVAQSRT